MILTADEEQQFDRVLEIVTYGDDGKPHFPEEAVQLLEELAADAYTHLMAKICEAPMGLALEMTVILWVPQIAEKLRKERQVF